MRGAFASCLEDFLYAILNDTAPFVTGLDGRHVTAVRETIHQSLATGETVTIAPPPAEVADS